MEQRPGNKLAICSRSRLGRKCEEASGATGRGWIEPAGAILAEDYVTCLGKIARNFIFGLPGEGLASVQVFRRFNTRLFGRLNRWQCKYASIGDRVISDGRVIRRWDDFSWRYLKHTNFLGECRTHAAASSWGGAANGRSNSGNRSAHNRRANGWPGRYLFCR